MDTHIILLAWISLIVIASSATSFPQSNPLSELLLSKRTPQSGCNSYRQLQRGLRRHGIPETRDIARELFNQDEITQASFRDAAGAMCRELVSLNRFRDTIVAMCPNADDVLANMDIFGGVCYANGTMTAFLEDLIDGFTASKFAWRNLCYRHVRPIREHCIPVSLDRSLDMRRGPQAYRKMMIERERCNAEGFDRDDLSDCGDLDSLKRLICFVDLMTTLGPGITFSLSDFGL